jgi:hypothetical protein
MPARPARQEVAQVSILLSHSLPRVTSVGSPISVLLGFLGEDGWGLFIWKVNMRKYTHCIHVGPSR